MKTERKENSAEIKKQKKNAAENTKKTCIFSGKQVDVS
jgi:hypothetical protein